MPAYAYESIPTDASKPPRRFEVKQSMKDAALTHDSHTGTDAMPSVWPGGRRTAGRLPVFVLGVLCLQLSLTAQEQTQPPLLNPQSPAGDSNVVQLPPVIVSGTTTATLTEREMDRISKPLSVLTSAQIDMRAPVNVQSLLDDVPGVSYSRDKT